MRPPAPSMPPMGPVRALLAHTVRAHTAFTRPQVVVLLSGGVRSRALLGARPLLRGTAPWCAVTGGTPATSTDALVVAWDRATLPHHAFAPADRGDPVAAALAYVARAFPPRAVTVVTGHGPVGAVAARAAARAAGLDDVRCPWADAAVVVAARAAAAAPPHCTADAAVRALLVAAARPWLGPARFRAPVAPLAAVGSAHPADAVAQMAAQMAARC